MKNLYDTDDKKKDIKSFVRVRELSNTPIKGNFDLDHLKKINAYIFQDSPDVAGKFRPEVKIHSNELWHKNRNYPRFGVITVCYSPMDKNSIKEAENVLHSINVERMKKLDQNELAKELSDIYKKLDYFHPFPDGNSRTLREFTRSLSAEVGFELDWSKHTQQEVYLARDFEVNTITLSKISDQNQKFFIEDEIEAILKHPQYKSLENIIHDSLTPLKQEQKKNYQVEFSYNKESPSQYSYNVLVNGVYAKDAIKQDPNVTQALTGLANHKDIKEKGITAEQLKSGVIYPQKLDNEIKVTRPENRTVDNQGNKIELTKAKASQLEL